MRRFVKDILLPLAVAVAIAFVIQAAVAKPYEIPTESMFPTIKANDRVIANRLIYRVRDIGRGDIIVFHPPAAATSTCGESGGGDIPYVKRVIGLPGDRIEVRRVIVPAGSRPSVRVRTDTFSGPGPAVRITLQPGDIESVTYVNGRPYDVQDALTPVDLRHPVETYGLAGPIAESGAYQFGPVTVPPDHLLVLGDNRPGSCDSHQWRSADGSAAPFVPEDAVIGQAEVTYWPPSHIGFLD